MWFCGWSFDLLAVKEAEMDELCTFIRDKHLTCRSQCFLRCPYALACAVRLFIYPFTEDSATSSNIRTTLLI